MSTPQSPARFLGAVNEMVRLLAERLEDPTMGAQQQRLLMALYIHGTVNQLDLPQYTGVERAANSRNIALLGDGQFNVRRVGRDASNAPGLVEAYEDPTNRRFKLVRLTPKGKALLDDVARAAMKYLPS